MGDKIIKTINISVNSILIAFGMYFFLVQHKIASGGVTGISLIFANWFSFFYCWTMVLVSKCNFICIGISFDG
ncbi:hypothetical protein ANHYDRO_00790 [Anaerococcus hydrogenalis DSM 7454]|uniref:Uncharacterized protein n=1 Tax=Anaerococcus hydrogenalis DSM 7454 TaxID=561177 RepID=B6W891_9FIRM|nr:YitT family protein [Anaerococcus hydrogenalis]EEB36490.1 hypothetical protein ANHYDRO_00790 [Anaerococcus hydrogenalis DSM 7454]